MDTQNIMMCASGQRVTDGDTADAWLQTGAAGRPADAVTALPIMRVLSVTLLTACLFGCSAQHSDASAAGITGDSATQASTEGAAASSSSADVNASGDTGGVVHYTGTVSGTARFYDAFCSLEEHGSQDGPPLRSLVARKNNEVYGPPRLTASPLGTGRWYVSFWVQGAHEKWSSGSYATRGIKEIQEHDRTRFVLRHVRLGGTRTSGPTMNKTEAGSVDISGRVDCKNSD